jgi:hypothetical protein
MRESCTYGSVRGARSNGRPYRNHLRNGRFREEVTMTDETTSRTDAAPAADANPGLGRAGRAG